MIDHLYEETVFFEASIARTITSIASLVFAVAGAVISNCVTFHVVAAFVIAGATRTKEKIEKRREDMIFFIGNILVQKGFSDALVPRVDAKIPVYSIYL